LSISLDQAEEGKREDKVPWILKGSKKKRGEEGKRGVFSTRREKNPQIRGSFQYILGGEVGKSRKGGTKTRGLGKKKRIPFPGKRGAVIPM